MKSKNPKNGFTLIELMIVVAIVGILAAIAYPSYQEQVRTSKRAECAGALVGLASAMERDFTLMSAYRDITAAPLNLYPATCPLEGGVATYNLNIALVGNTYTLSAVPIGGGPQAGDKCGTFTLTNTGKKDITGQHAGINSDNCW